MLRRVLVPATVALLTLLTSVAAMATAQRTFVATTGHDSNVGANCSLVSPCRSFGAALGVTDPNGELVVVDSGGYGRVTINQSIAITAPAGVYAGISVFSGANGVDIVGPGIRVVLRGLAINGQGGDSGIAIVNGNEVVIERCTVSNMAFAGIEVLPAQTLRLSVADSVFSANLVGLSLQGAAQHVTVAILRTRIERSAHQAIQASNNVDVHVADSIISGSAIGIGFAAVSAISALAPVRLSIDATHVIDNGSQGIQIIASASGGDARATVTRSTIARNGGGGLSAQASAAGARADLLLASSTVADNASVGVASFSSGGSTHVVVSESTIVDNIGVGMAGTSGTFYTRNNNTLRGNNGAELSNQTSGTITLLGGS